MVRQLQDPADHGLERIVVELRLWRHGDRPPVTTSSLQDAFGQHRLCSGLTVVAGADVDESRPHHLAVAPVTGQTVVAGQQLLDPCGLDGGHGGRVAAGPGSLSAGKWFICGSGCCRCPRVSGRVRTARAIRWIGGQHFTVILGTGGLQWW